MLFYESNDTKHLLPFSFNLPTTPQIQQIFLAEKMCEISYWKFKSYIDILRTPLTHFTPSKTLDNGVCRTAAATLGL